MELTVNLYHGAKISRNSTGVYFFGSCVDRGKCVFSLSYNLHVMVIANVEGTRQHKKNVRYTISKSEGHSSKITS